MSTASFLRQIALMQFLHIRIATTSSDSWLMKAFCYDEALEIAMWPKEKKAIR